MGKKAPCPFSDTLFHGRVLQQVWLPSPAEHRFNNTSSRTPTGDGKVSASVEESLTQHCKAQMWCEKVPPTMRMMLPLGPQQCCLTSSRHRLYYSHPFSAGPGHAQDGELGSGAGLSMQNQPCPMRHVHPEALTAGIYSHDCPLQNR